jgi:hypothetical protein
MGNNNKNENDKIELLTVHFVRLVISTTVLQSVTFKLLGDAEATFGTHKLLAIRSLTHFCPNSTETLCSNCLVSRDETAKNIKGMLEKQIKNINKSKVT